MATMPMPMQVPPDARREAMNKGKLPGLSKLPKNMRKGMKKGK